MTAREELAAAMTGLWQAERERADRLEAMLDRLAERLVVLPDLWREEGRAVLRNAAGDDLTVHQRVGKWLHDKTVIPPAEGCRYVYPDGTRCTLSEETHAGLGTQVDHHRFLTEPTGDPA